MDFTLATQDHGAVYKAQPIDAPGRLLVEGNATVIDAASGQVVLAQRVLAPGHFGNLRAELLRLTEYESGRRLSGFTNQMRTFGFAPPSPLRRRYACAPCALDRQKPALSAALGAAARRCEAVFSEVSPEAHEAHLKVMTAIDGAWRINRTGAFSSGIINRTAALPYHRDAGNLKGAWSVMLVLRSGMEGGRLHVPDYDVELSCDDGAVVVFKGQSILHGVTPLHPLGRGAWRFSVVFYAKQALATCLAPEFEAKRAQIRRTASEDRKGLIK